MTICPNCGSDSEDDSVFCEQCGYQITKKAQKFTEQPNQSSSVSEPKKIKFVRQKK